MTTFIIGNCWHHLSCVQYRTWVHKQTRYRTPANKWACALLGLGTQVLLLFFAKANKQLLLAAAKLFRHHLSQRGRGHASCDMPRCKASTWVKPTCFFWHCSVTVCILCPEAGKMKQLPPFICSRLLQHVCQPLLLLLFKG